MLVDGIVVDPVAKFEWQAQERELLRLDGSHAASSQLSAPQGQRRSYLTKFSCVSSPT